ncbi:MAG: redox-regulated ATPase YchF [Rhodospirillales bacterium]|jgi:GTP-binding protein YchF|tara:strand:+ start:327 stop:1427 length:1101 start_codon:yes stop_codon:yes gene_type:complete
MGFNCGIVGLPNVGKSTLFNALTATAVAEAANFPFCTIEPNIGRVSVPDERLEKISEITKSAKIISTQLEFVDIAGLVRGASKGEGLGNQFLANIREVDAIIHVLRCFEDENVTHVEGDIEPIRDAETVETELMLADMESLEKRVNALEKRAKGDDKEAKQLLRLVQSTLELLRDGVPARKLEVSDDDKKAFGMLQLLTSKPVLYACNVEEESASDGNALSAKVAEMAAAQGATSVVVSAKIEEEVSQLADAEEKAEFLEALGLHEAGLDRVIRAGYSLLKLITFFTSGPKETRAWTVFDGALGPQAAGVIHTDFERGYIKAETIAYDNFVSLGGEQAVKDAGKMRQEGKTYQVKDGDIMLFRFNV